MLKHLLFILSFALVSSSLFSQKDKCDAEGTYCMMKVIEGDTIASVILEGATIEANAKISRRQSRKNSRLRSKVIKVYPYAAAAGDLMEEYAIEFEKIESEKEKRKYLKKAEEELKTEFEGELKKLTISEGVILIKLIDRETGDTSYGLIQELKGNFSAFMWQSFARIFGHNLKDEYDAYGRDWPIESIVEQIESGNIDTRTVQASAAKIASKSRKRK